MSTCNEPSCGENGSPFLVFFNQRGRHTDLCLAHAEPLLRIAAMGEPVRFPYTPTGMNAAQFHFLTWHENDDEYRKMGL